MTETTTTDLEAEIDAMLATRESRREDWDTLAFQTKAGPEYRRAQIRYMGSGGTGNHEADENIIPADHFTFSNMLLPPGAVGPEHTHHDVEEAFFVLNDVTRRNALQSDLEIRSRELETANKSLAALNAELDRFATVAAHDLQEPLRKISSFSEMPTMMSSSSCSSMVIVWAAPSSSGSGGSACIDFCTLKAAVIMKKISSRKVTSTMGVMSRPSSSRPRRLSLNSSSASAS